MPNVPQAVKRLNDAGYLVLIVTNQRGVARGMMSADDVEEVHQHMCAVLKKSGAHIDGIYVCPHEEGTCTCRKPNIGLFLQAERDYGIDKALSWMIGDSDSDAEAGRRYGVRTIKTNRLMDAVRYIMLYSPQGDE